MKTQKILTSEVSPLKISSLPTRPTAPTAFGGKGYSAYDMKAAFDKLPLLIIERFNSLIDDICSGSILDAISVDSSEGMSLATIIEDIENGNIASYLSVGDTSLATAIADLRARVEELEGRI